MQKAEKMYERGRAFTYLLVKESVVKDVINVSLFAYDKITLKLKMLTKEDKTLIKIVWESKTYWVKRLIKEFPNKKENQPQTHHSTRQISRQLGLPQTNNWR